MARVILLTGAIWGRTGDAKMRCPTNLRSAWSQTAASSLWESRLGDSSAEQFLNQVLIFETALEPEHVLDICQIEREKAGGSVRERADGIATGTGCQAGAGCNKTAGRS